MTSVISQKNVSKSLQVLSNFISLDIFYKSSMFVTHKKPNKTLYTKRDTGFSAHIVFELERNYMPCSPSEVIVK